mmetsp:Transcript_21571/g.71341  ORF Transcript_21571/g.71341 Transcript_21571/m.71341 type:complete len:415 (+) Transcript_21571:116-1360(+)
MPLRTPLGAASALQPVKVHEHRVLRVQQAFTCTDMGLGFTHLRLNLECGLKLASLTGRQLELDEVLEPPKHTGCKRAVNTSWSDLVDLSEQPVASRGTRRAVSGVVPERLQFSTKDDILQKARNSTAAVVELLLDPVQAKYCNYYQACASLPVNESAERLPSSAAVRAAADAMAKRFGGRFNAVHVRQTDKVTEPKPSLAVPALTPRALAQHLKALLPPEHARNGSRARLPLYIATDAPELRTSCLDACYTSYVWHDLRPTLELHAPRGARRRLKTCTPYWVVAVEQEVMQRAGSIVLSDTSNFGRAVAVARRKRRGPEHQWLLMSLARLPPVPVNATVAALELAYVTYNSSEVPESARSIRAWLDMLALPSGVQALPDPSASAIAAKLSAAHSPSLEPNCPLPPSGKLACGDV